MFHQTYPLYELFVGQTPRRDGDLQHQKTQQQQHSQEQKQPQQKQQPKQQKQQQQQPRAGFPAIPEAKADGDKERCRPLDREAWEAGQEVIRQMNCLLETEDVPHRGVLKKASRALRMSFRSACLWRNFWPLEIRLYGDSVRVGICVQPRESTALKYSGRLWLIQPLLYPYQKFSRFFLFIVRVSDYCTYGKVLDLLRSAVTCSGRVMLLIFSRVARQSYLTVRPR